MNAPKIYSYDEKTGETRDSRFAQLDPLTSQMEGRPVYFPPGSTSCETMDVPLSAKEGYAVCRINNQWQYVDDCREQEYWHKDTGVKIVIAKLGATIPAGYPTQAPPPGTFKPKWNGQEWIETAIVYQEIKVQTKADVDLITRQRIAALGEEKAKTEKLLAGSDPCPIWDSFIAARALIIQEGDEFIIANSLT